MRLALGLSVTMPRSIPGPALAYAAGGALAGSSFARSSTATYLDSGGLVQSAGTNVLRDGHYVAGVRTMLLEDARTNHFLNSGAPVTQTSPSLATGTYTLWLVGTGSVAVAGTTATITGAGTATAGSPVVFTVTVAGTVTYTVTGSPTRVQSELGAFATSYVPTAGASVTRATDMLSVPITFAPKAATYYAKFVEAGTITTGGWLLNIGSGVAPNFDIKATAATGYRIQTNNGSSSVNATAALVPTIGQTVEVRGVFNVDGSVQIAVSVNGGAETVSAASAGLTPGAAWSANTLWIGSQGGVAAGYADFIAVKIAFGVRTLTEMRSL